MVSKQIAGRGVKDPRVLAAMEKVPRHLFVPDNIRSHAYEDSPLPIGYNQTISQPYIVAYMTEQLVLEGDERVLEVGTGSGYQAAVLAELVPEVYTIEIIEPLSVTAREQIEKAGFENVHFRVGDGYLGWPEAAPFDAIMITAAPRQIPETLIGQLRVGGRMIVPVGQWHQELLLITKKEKDYSVKKLLPVRFVPMVRSRSDE
ncbi:MAG TPA: protein-L-isoaspartate(D-aspartate) O-methyltransferase [bacterium]|nr:protein-L-isoaspartate(D-aspartate) O-methyltransferase [bacterium]